MDYVSISIHLKIQLAMKTFTQTRLLKVTVFLTFILLSMSFMFSNPTCPRNYTGAPSASNGQVRFCTQCHNDFDANTGGGGLLITGLPTSTYLPGQAYNFTIRINFGAANKTIWGFAIKAVNTTNNNVVGTFTTTNPNASVKGSVANQDLELSHSTSATTAAANNYTYTNLTWTAPAAPNGNESSIRFYITGVAGDGDDSQAGDYVYTTTQSVALGTLPITLASFEAIQTANPSIVLLKWQTATEANTSLFELQGSSNGTDWSSVGSVSAKGHSANLLSYTFEDNRIIHRATGANYYYRIKVIDKDGRYQYTDVKSIHLKNPAITIYRTSASVTNANTAINFRVLNNVSNTIRLSVVDASGRLLYAKTVITHQGLNDVSIPADVTHSASGILYIRFSGNCIEQTFKQLIN